MGEIAWLRGGGKDGTEEWERLLGLGAEEKMALKKVCRWDGMGGRESEVV